MNSRTYGRLERRLLRAQAAAEKQRVQRPGRYAKYATDPEGYARDVLGVEWWPKQVEIAKALITPPYKVLVKASHSVGKSHLAAGLVNWWYDCFDPGVCITTAPTARQVRDILWKEVRRQRGPRIADFRGPKIPRMESSPAHFAYGFTAKTSTSFQGQHEEAILLIFDEAVGIPRELWEGADSMVQGARYGWLCICNPTSTTSEFRQRELRGGWHVIHIPCTEHPNIHAELAGLPPVYPSAVRLDWLEDKLGKWADPVDPPATPDASLLEWPPGSGRWLKPGPLAESRLLGRWPTITEGVWSDALWSTAEERRLELPPSDCPEIGCDVARFGDDWTEMHVRCGPVSLHHERHNGWDTAQTAGRLKQLAAEYAAWQTARLPAHSAQVNAQDIAIKVDDDGVGGGVLDQADGYRFVGVTAAARAAEPKSYPNRRSELWFTVQEAARRGALDLSRLSPDVLLELRRQAIAPAYTIDSAGRRVVEPKPVTKGKIGRSPDGMDAMNLAYAADTSGAVAQWVPAAEEGGRNWRDRHG